MAVLPFRNISSEPAAPYLADELTDQLISTLGQIGSLQVPSLTSVLQFRDRPASMVEIGKQLRVDDIVEATLLVVRGKDGGPDRVRINARLIAAGSDSQIWAQEFERSMGDTLALQAEVARAIAEGIRAVLTPSERRRLNQVRPTTPAANEAYYQGLHYLSQSSADGQRAVDAFRRAIDARPGSRRRPCGSRPRTSGTSDSWIASRTRKRARWRSRKPTRRWRSTRIRAEAAAALADLRFYYDWDWSGADRVVSTRHRAQHELCEGPLAVRALPGRGRPW